MDIRITANVEVFELPPAIHLPEGSCLRDALSIIAPQLIDPRTGNYRDDPDIWGVRLNGEPIYLLKDKLDTRMNEGDTIRLELIIMAGG